MGQAEVGTGTPAGGGATASTPPGPQRSSIGAAALWMLGLSLLLFWLPFLGPIIAGVVGGKKAGSVGRAILAALLPSIVTGVLFFLLATLLTGMPILGFIAGLGAGALAATGIGSLLVGAILGGLLA